MLTRALLEQGWAVRVSLVSAAAAQAYQQLRRSWPLSELELRIGALQGPAEIVGVLQHAACQGRPVQVVVDATHPFAIRISHDLRQACERVAVPLLRLGREPLPLAGAELLSDLEALAGIPLAGERLLLALGSRHLAQAMACTPGALHHARVLANPLALQLALAAGLAPERVACLRPSEGFVVEAALLEHWGITAVLCRQSGGRTEAGWQRLALQRGCRLLVLRRPSEPAEALPLEALLVKLKHRRSEEARGRSPSAPGAAGPHQ